MTTPTYGIDLGTTCSAIGLVQDGTPRLLPVEEGQPLLPSVVSFPLDGPPIVGRAALNRLALDPSRTIRSAKRDMGTERRWAIGDEEVGAEDVAAHVLRRLCDGVVELGLPRPERVVLTVPAWFPQPARAATRRAGEAAGLEVVRLVNEPTAAALAHAHGQAMNRRALVYDLGGGTFDVSLVDQHGLLTEVLASHGDTRLGGDDVDAALLELVIERLEDEEDELASLLQRDPSAQAHARQAVEAAKIQLSSEAEAVVRAPFVGVVGGEARHLEVALSRDDLAEVVAPLIERTLRSVRRVLHDAGTSAANLDELLLVGGMSQTPHVFAALLDELGLEGSAAISPDRAVGLGAAIQAAILDGSRVDGMLVDVAPYSLSVAAARGEFHGLATNYVCRVVTPRNSPLPSRHTEIFHTVGPRQASIAVPVLQGADPNPLNNQVLGRVRMDGIPDAPRGRFDRPIAVEFRHDLDGLVHIEVRDQLSGRTEQGRVAADGDEVAELRGLMIEEMGDLVPGWGEEAADEPDPGPSSVQELFPAGASPSEAPGEQDPRELERTFARVLAERASLDHLEAADVGELLRLARDGITKLAAGDTEAASDCHDELADRMFELGVYL